MTADVELMMGRARCTAAEYSNIASHAHMPSSCIDRLTRVASPQRSDLLPFASRHSLCPMRGTMTLDGDPEGSHLPASTKPPAASLTGHHGSSTV